MTDIKKTRLTVAEAANLAGVSIKTVYRHISMGKLSAEKNKAGVKMLDLSELERVFDLSKASRDSLRLPSNLPEKDTDQTAKDAEIEGLKRLLAEKDARIQELKNDKDRLQAMLEYKPEGKAAKDNPGKISGILMKFGL